MVHKVKSGATPANLKRYFFFGLAALMLDRKHSAIRDQNSGTGDLNFEVVFRLYAIGKAAQFGTEFLMRVRFFNFWIGLVCHGKCSFLKVENQLH